MRIVFDPAFDDGAWPGPLQGSRAVLGEEWVGTRGLIERLELELGLSGPNASNQQRELQLLAALAEHEDFWSKSFSSDPLGTARQMLRWWDYLQEHALPTGDTGAPRIDSLRRACASIAPSIWGRVQAVTKTLGGRSTSVKQLCALGLRGDYSAGYQALFGALEASGTSVDFQPVGDEHDGRSFGLAARDDAKNSVRLLRPAGQLAAAEEVAAFLGRLDRQATTVVIAPSPVLDEACSRFGAPRNGARYHGRSGHLLILPAALKLLHAPVDPQAAYRFLMLPRPPLSRSLARSLARSLHDWPAVGSPSWERATSHHVEKADDPVKAQKQVDAMQAFFGGTSGHGAPLKRSELSEQARRVRDYLGRLRPEADEELGLAVRQVTEFERALEHWPEDELTESSIQRLVEAATPPSNCSFSPTAEAGVASVGQPGAVTSPAKHVIWWDFVTSPSQNVYRPPLTSLERSKLADAGCVLPERGQQEAVQSRRARRPLLMAEETIVLVCPTRSASGERQRPHPLWDEISCKVGGGEDAAALSSTTVWSHRAPDASQRRPSALPKPRRAWRVAPGSIEERKSESPSSLATLVGCSFNHALHYAAGVRPGLSHEPSLDSRDYGNLSHDLLAEGISAGLLDDEHRAAKLREELASRGRKLVAGLFLPENAAALASMETRLTAAAEQLAAFCDENALRPAFVEESIEGDLDGIPLAGTPDVVFVDDQDRGMVLDFKWGGESYRRGDLEDGLAYQLALYALLLKQRGLDPAAAGYLILGSQRLLATSGSPFTRTTPVEGPELEATLSATSSSAREALVQLRAGRAVATGVSDGPDAEKVEPSIASGSLVLSPPCRFCDFDALCGRAFGGGS